MLFILLLATLALITIGLITVINSFTFPRLSRIEYRKKDLSSSLVSVLIPARNEANVIEESVRNILSQQGVDFEVIVLDDHSTDETSQLALRAANGDPRICVVQGKELPPGWTGKNWACHQLSCLANGDWLVFTDADVIWEPEALSALISYAAHSEADMVTVWPTQETYSWSERLVVPLMAMAVWGYLPVLAVHWIPWPVFSAANGQCLAFNRLTYQNIGGHKAVRESVLDDMKLAWITKRCSRRLRMIDAAGMIRCRMYHQWGEVRDGFAKNILAGHGNSLLFLGFSALFHWLLFLLPWIWLGLGWVSPTWSLFGLKIWPLWPLMLILMGLMIRALSAAATRQRVFDALLLPCSIIYMTCIAIKAVSWKFKGGPIWKGRRLPS